ncbi:STAS domain-containing protein [Streptomyces sp. NPDC059037]|uniref:STAS domain-containing protein n=1 Tax=Streptomyces sp. NPDC059037 TaxID=3346710 RepID=UPI00367F79F3
MPRFRPHLPGRSRPKQGRRREVVRLRGEITGRNASSTTQLMVQALNAGPEVLEVDLDRVTYLSPDGCVALFAALRAARERDTRLIITHADARTASTLDRIGFSRALSGAEE